MDGTIVNGMRKGRKEKQIKKKNRTEEKNQKEI